MLRLPMFSYIAIALLLGAGPGRADYLGQDFAQAVRSSSLTNQTCEIAADQTGDVTALAQRGETLLALGQLERADQDLRAALAIAQRRNDGVTVAALIGARGTLAFQAHDLDRAKRLLEISVSDAERQGAASVAAVSTNNLGNVLAARGDLRAAAGQYSTSARLAGSAGDRHQVATALINHARMTLALGDAGVDAELTTAMQAVSALPDDSEKTLDFIALGHLAQPALGQAGRPAGVRLATEALTAGSRLAARSNDARAQSLSAGYLGELYESQGKFDEAEAAARRAIRFGQVLSADDLLFRWEWLNGRLARARGRKEVSIAAYRRAVASLQSIRQDVSPDFDNPRSTYRSTVGAIYFELADLMLQQAAQPNQSAETVNVLLTESRNTVEELRTASVREYFHDPCLSNTRSVSTQTFKDPNLQAGTALLYPIILPDRVELLLTFSGNDQERVAVRVPQSQLTDTVRAMRVGMESGSNAYVAPSQQLYHWIIEPIRAALDRRHVSTLLVVPDGPLQTVPFAAFSDRGRFLIADYAVATLPSLELTDLHRGTVASNQVLLSGISKPIQGYAALPYVESELRGVAKAQPQVTMMENEQFQLRLIEEALRSVPYRVVHIASHGEFGSDPTRTFILTFDGHLTLNQLEQDIKYNSSRNEPLDLLVLSACNTASGDDRAALGLAGIAVKAGARSAVATLWSINDEAAATMFPDFYRRLAQPGMTKARALQQAQLELLHQPRFRNAGYWAPFILVGNWM